MKAVGVDEMLRLTCPQDEVAAAQPDIDKRTEQLVAKGRWQVPGYKVSPMRSAKLQWI
jgi:hypothetical protein